MNLAIAEKSAKKLFKWGFLSGGEFTPVIKW